MAAVPPLNLSQLPKLPGLNSSRPVASPRGQGFKIVNGLLIDADPTKNATPRGMGGVASCLSARTVAPDHFLTTSRAMGSLSARSDLPLSTEPSFIALDKKVLRFWGYFKQAIHESAIETVRVRRLALHYFLEDGTIELTEPRENNSGLQQGKFLKRGRLNKPDGSPYHWSDLTVDSDFHASGRVLRLYDADEFTRGFYASQGSPLGPATVDPATQARKPTRPEAPASRRRNPLRAHAEARLGRVAHQSGKTKQFLENDRHVLRFAAEYDDRDRLYGELHVYTLNFFLADDTMEIKEDRKPNSGRDAFPLLLSRQQCPKHPVVELGASNERTEDAPEGEFFRPLDLRVGATINVYSRPLKLVDCDDYTRNYYRNQLGVVQAAAMNTRVVVEPPPRVPTPPHTGFGTEEDSRAACESLVPKTRKHDFSKFVEHANTVLRFKANLVDEQRVPLPTSRKFIVMFYVADDTVQVFEPVQRNSGVMGGKFLQRGKHRNPQGEYYVQDDFAIGKIVSFNSHHFLLGEADAFTDSYLQQAAEDSARNAQGLARQRDIAAAAMVRVREALAASGAVNGLRSLRRRFDQLDLDGSGAVSGDELGMALRDFNVMLSPAEVDAVFTVLDRDNSGSISIDELQASLRGHLSTRRRALIGLCFDVLERDGDGKVSVDDLHGRFDFGHLPAVASGAKSTAEATLDFLTLWDSTQDGIVSYAEFEDYYKDISALINDDDHFEAMLRNAWRIPGGEGAAANTANRRVLVVHSNGMEEVIAIRNALGLDKNNIPDVKARLKAQGVVDIARVSFA